jgi:hypothetical protein
MPFVGEPVCSFLGCRTAFTRSPGEEPAELGGEAGLDLTPPPHGARRIRRPRAVVHPDQSGNGQESLAGNLHAQLVRDCPRARLAPPSLMKAAEVTVEAAGSPGHEELVEADQRYRRPRARPRLLDRDPGRARRWPRRHDPPD